MAARTPATGGNAVSPAQRSPPAAPELLDADRTASAEVRHRTAARDVLADTIRHPDAPATVVSLAVTLGVS
ncbi:hypothetical protein EYA84_06765 [Verrucosispora sp. SN26_14.1]|uniref:hypothetical protein n=1 Tax=Verrucosispora sp. SN26_14.1 TaxID=2527879 RepID=UPI001033A61F|nr:hypothetical protein [Verrucosispora sp. SN26_14.1]TBL40778.1 hypothetical protein EYA84_06765 [Verrucosispora sp. SN26_14.1]